MFRVTMMKVVVMFPYNWYKNNKYHYLCQINNNNIKSTRYLNLKHLLDPYPYQYLQGNLIMQSKIALQHLQTINKNNPT